MAKGMLLDLWVRQNIKNLVLRDFWLTNQGVGNTYINVSHGATCPTLRNRTKRQKLVSGITILFLTMFSVI